MTIFISRNYPAAAAHPSPLQRWAAAGGHTLIARSFLRFAPVKFIAPVADWWFFYSPRAVDYGIAQLPDGVRVATMGAGTAASLPDGITADFVGEGRPEAVAAAFAEVAAGRRVFFPRARQSRRSVQRLVADRLTVLDAVCYDNRAVPATEPIVADVYVFTSPLNVAAYLDHQPLARGARVVAIGPSTARAQVPYGVSGATLEEPSEDALVGWLTTL